MRTLILIFCLLVARGGLAPAVEHVVMRQAGGGERAVSGRLLQTAQDGGLLLLAPDGALWAVPPEDLISHEHDDQPMRPLSADALGVRLLEELPDGFELHATQHYLICHNTSHAYAQWCGALLERLHKGFVNFWTRKNFKLHEPEFPLVALVFADKKSYAAYARREVGDAADLIIGGYNLQSNRIMMYDLTGLEGQRGPDDRRGNPAQINQLLSRPEAERTVATIIHEATHQIAFNRGLQTRYADIPLWLSEGIAMYFETPDLAAAKGWRTIGAVNRVQLDAFLKYLPRRPEDSLATLVSSHERLHDAKLFRDAYAEAWALNYFLLRQRPKQYLQYVKMLSEKKELMTDTPDTRLREFREAFGDLDALDADFVRQMRKLR
jgi:hypothetical protein